MLTFRLKQLRAIAKKSQKEIAAELGLDYKRYNHYETGRSEPDNATLMQIADYFRVTVDSLLGCSKTKKASPSEDELAELLQEPLMGEIYKAALQLSPQHRKMVLAQIQAVQEIEDNVEKKDAR